jgi:hypothetical protein
MTMLNLGVYHAARRQAPQEFFDTNPPFDQPRAENQLTTS